MTSHGSRQRSTDIAVLLISTAGPVVVTALLRMIPDVSDTTVALALLLVVLAVATFGRRWIAIVASLSAMLALNFFFLEPIGAFTITNPQNWVALFAFLAVAVIASHLSAAAQARAREAIIRRNEVTRLFDLTRDVLLTTETSTAMEALARHAARRFELTSVAVCLPGESGWRVYQGGTTAVSVDPDTLDLALARARGVIEFDARTRAYGGALRVQDGVSIVPLRHGTKPVGLLVTVAPSLDLGTLDALAGVVAIAIERAQFLADRDAADLVRQRAALAATLLASLSHDLKTPLTVVRVAVENLTGEIPAADRRSQAAAALSEIDRLSRLFQDILDMARIDAAAIRADHQWVTPADIVDAAAAYVRHELAGRALRVNATADREIEIDPKLASAALSHLLENAARYSPADREIHVDAAASSDGLHVTVTDHGDGLDPAELDHLFERFYRGRVAKLSSPGTGMGLAITRGLLAAAGGRVWAENVRDAGARFSMVVPGRVRAVSPAA